MSSALDKVLKLAGGAPEEDPAGLLVLAARTAVGEVLAYLAGSEDDGKPGDDDHSSHATYKALVKRGMDEKKAASMCAKADNRVKATRLAAAALSALSGLEAPEEPADRAAARQYLLAASRPGEDGMLAVSALLSLSVLTAEDRRKPGAHTIGDSEDYPIPDKAHLYAAVARYKEGKLAGHSREQVAAHIRHHARRLGEEVDLASGSGLDEAADLIMLAAKAAGDGGIIMNHAPFTGTHSHTHFQSQAHAHPHQHFGDNNHEGGPQHRPGSKPGGRPGW
jgi:hypothetical protein